VSLPTLRVRRAPLVLLVLAVAVVLAGCGSSAAAPVVPVAGDHALQVDGRDRSYLLRPAQGLVAGRRAAVVVVLHQEGGTARQVADETELTGLTAQGATLVYPEGVDHSWDAGTCCGLPSREGVDDVAFLDAVIKDVEARTPVDPRRAALVGYSSGGMLAYHYVCARPGALRAAVVVSGSLESPCAPDISVPDVLTLHGQKDGTIGLERSRFISALGLSPRPVSGTLRELTASAGCDAPVTSAEPGAAVYRWSGCRGGVVEAKVIAGAGHGWGNLGASARTAEFLRDQLLQG
jgi:polyhydroxybutyrate depolymerase